LALLVERLRRGPVSWPWIVSCGLATGLFFHAGNAQMWFYGLIFMALDVGLLLFTRALPVQRCWALVCGWLLGAALAAPLVVVQAAEVKGVERTPWGLGFRNSWASFFLPRPLDGGGMSNFWPGETFYSGTVFTILALGALACGVLWR